MTKTPLRWILSLGAIASALAIAPAAAADEASATRAFKDGLAHARSGDDERALASFASAYAEIPSVDILWNLAVVEQRMGRASAALAHLRAYVAHRAARPERVALARTAIAELEPRVGKVTIEAEHLGEVRVDGELRVGTVLELDPGVHTVVAELGGREIASAVEVRAGAHETLRLSAHTPSATAPSPALAVPASPSPPLAAAPPPSPALAGAPPPSAARATASGSRGQWVPLGLLLGAAGVAATGVAFSIAAGDARDEAERLHGYISTNVSGCPRTGSLCDQYDAARTRAQLFGGIGTGAFVTAGVLGGAAITTWLLAPSERTVVEPVVVGAGQGGGVRLRGTF